MTIHFHGGPWAGEEKEVEAPLRSVIMVPGEGRYVQAQDSAGGRCYDWMRNS